LRESFQKDPDESLARVMNCTVEEFRRDYDSSAYGMARLLAGRIPRDVGLRFRQLQELLFGQFEFEARFPAAYEALFPTPARKRDRAGLYLPSFDVHVLNSYPQYYVQSQDEQLAGDAYTFTDNRSKNHPWGTKVERSWLVPDYEDLQGILLAVLNREEYGERIKYWQLRRQDSDLFDSSNKPPKAAYVRLTDLRLAKHLKSNTLRRGLAPVLALMEPPVTKDHVLEWKLLVLGSRLESPFWADPGVWRAAVEELRLKDQVKISEGDVPENVSRTGNGSLLTPSESFSPLVAQSELLKEQFGDEKSGILAVSFSAAALLLMIDLDMPGLTTASFRRSAEWIETLAEIVRDLTASLDRSTSRLEALTANRTAGRQPDLAGNDYRALRLYRMGRSLRETAEWLEITPYSSRTGQGTRDWKARVKQRLRNGKRIEDERYPRVAAIIANRENQHVRRKARRAYRRYLVEKGQLGDLFSWTGVGYYIRTGSCQTQRSLEVTFAYVQLGSCIMQGIPTVP
jgi:hypothetical protein